MIPQYIVKSNNQTVLKIYASPGSSKTEIVGLYGEPARLKIKVKAPPVDGEANDEIITYLAKFLKISKGRIQIDKGITSKQKDLLIDMPYEEVKIIFNFN